MSVQPLRRAALMRARRWHWFGLLFLLALPLELLASDMLITPFVGFRDVGDFEDVATGSTVDIDESETLGLIVGWEMEGGVFEIVYSRQDTELTGGSSVSAAALVDVEISHLLVAGRATVDSDWGGYFGFMLGATQFDFDGPGFDTETRPALGFDGGVDYLFSDSLSLRAGLRGVFTFVDTDDDAFCDSSTSCPIVADDNVLEQWEVFTGLTFRF